MVTTPIYTKRKLLRLYYRVANTFLEDFYEKNQTHCRGRQRRVYQQREGKLF